MVFQEQSIWSKDNNVELDMSEGSVGVSNSLTASDPDAFDAVIGSIEDMLADEEFQQLYKSFMDQYYLEFDDSNENKPSYTPIFNEYVELLEQRIPDLNTKTFTELLMRHRDEIVSPIVDTLLTFIDFVAFKQMFLDYRAQKEGRAVDLSHCIVVTSMTPAEAQ